MNAAFKRNRPLPILAVAALALAACADEAPVAPDLEPANGAAVVANESREGLNRAIAKLRRATDRYHNVNNAIADGFVFLHPCEVRDEGPVGTVYVHPGRLDGVIDPALPEALIYEPGRKGRLKLVGVELVIPFSLWTDAEPPKFFGAEFQPEDEFGVFGLHVWAWRHNPNGIFAETNPNVRCLE